MFQKYELDILSTDTNKKYKTFDVDGEKTLGVYENEPFKIKFKNNSSKKVQVRVSVDGTDVLTGETAHTRTEGRMWVVGAYQTLELKAWPEDNDGGAEFLFGKTEDSVAANTHGDMRGRGIIAVAVFEETYDPFRPNHYMNPDVYIKGSSSPLRGMRSRIGNSLGGGQVYRSVAPTSASFSLNDSDSLSEGPAVGAGDYQEQKITKAAGLTKPVFAKTLQVKYEWWTSLRSKIRQIQGAPTAFPGDSKNIDLGSTPRLETPEGRKRRIRRKSSEGTRLRPEEKYVEYNRFA